MWQLVHDCYGEELGLTSDDEDYISHSSAVQEEKLSKHLSLDSFSEVCSLAYVLMYFYSILITKTIIYLFFENSREIPKLKTLNHPINLQNLH